MNLAKDTLTLNEERMVELINITKNIKKSINDLCLNYKNTSYMTTEDKIRKALYLYHFTFKHTLNEQEKAIIALYTIITDDTDFNNNILYYKGDLEHVGKIYGVSKNFVILRRLVEIKVKMYEKKQKKLKLENK